MIKNSRRRQFKYLSSTPDYLKYINSINCHVLVLISQLKLPLLYIGDIQFQLWLVSNKKKTVSLSMRQVWCLNHLNEGLSYFLLLPSIKEGSNAENLCLLTQLIIPNRNSRRNSRTILIDYLRWKAYTLENLMSCTQIPVDIIPYQVSTRSNSILSHLVLV